MKIKFQFLLRTYLLFSIRTNFIEQLPEEPLNLTVYNLPINCTAPYCHSQETVFNSVRKTGKCIVTHEAPLTSGFGAELAAAIQVNLRSLTFGFYPEVTLAIRALVLIMS